MAVELRCPECRAKLRLQSAPEPGTEVECPKCEHIFVAPESEVAERPRKRVREDDDADEDDRPRKKVREDDAEEDRPRDEGGVKTKKKKSKKKDDNQPKRKRAKKKETNPLVLVFIGVFGLMILGLIVTLLVWYMSRTPPAYEMMNYLPEDTHSVTGLNITHCQKYAEFFKQVEQSYQNKAFKKAADALAKAAGTQTNDLIDYMVYGESKNGDVIILRTKTPFDTSSLSKLPGAKKSQDGLYYTVASIEGVAGSAGMRVFAPTDRLIVFSPATIPETTFRNMLKGNADNPEKSVVGRMGQLGKRVTRGTWWGFRLIDGPLNKPAGPPPLDPKGQGLMVGGDEGDRALKQIAVDAAGSAKGYGFKISIGSRTARFEVIVWHKDEDAARSWYDKFKESPLAKGDEEEPPRWWKKFMQGFGDKKMSNELLSAVGAKASGELFYLYSEVDTPIFMTGMSSVITKIVPDQPQGGGNMPGGGPPGEGPGK